MKDEIKSMMAIGAEATGIARVAVIGAGAMGGGIAAQFANAGIPVELLDMPGGDSGCEPCKAGIARQVKIGGFMVPEAAALVRAGNVKDHLERLADCDWIIEAVIEKLDIKRDLFASMAPHLKPGVLLSSNTSTIQLAALIEGMEPNLARRFAITHFFNPPRVMPLLEIVTGPDADPQLGAQLAHAAKVLLGKTVITCCDTPGFIANRIGCFWMAVGALEARRLGLNVETADAVHVALGLPGTGVFGLFDLVGMDLVPNVWGSLLSALPNTDALHRFDLPANPLFQSMFAAGRFGRKVGGGFYRKAADGSREALDLETLAYRPVTAPLPMPSRDPKALLAETGVVGDYARTVLGEVLAYARAHAPDIAADPSAIDTALELGYSWKQGPFALAEKAGLTDPDSAPRRSRGPSLDDRPVILSNAQATLHDLGDGVACFRARSKMNTFAPEVMDLMEKTLERAGQDFQALVLGNDHPRAFSAGADLGFFNEMLDGPNGGEVIDRYGERGQALFVAMRNTPVPVVAAIHGFVLGGGCEFQMHADATVALAEVSIGLPETGVGLLPGWGGCKCLLYRALDTDPSATPLSIAERAFATVFSGHIAGSAAEAKTLGLLRPDDGIVMHRDLLIEAAKIRALSLVPGYAVPAPRMLSLAGPAGMAKLLEKPAADLAAGTITETDYLLAEVIASVLTGGPDADPARPISEADFMVLERSPLTMLIQNPQALARINHTLATGKRLKN